MGGYVVDYSLIDAEDAAIEAACSALLDIVKTCQNAANTLSSTDQLMGKTADNMKSYILTYHLKVLEAIQNICHIIKNKWRKYYNDYKSQVDAFSGAYIAQEDLLSHFKDTVEKCGRVSISIADDMVNCVSAIGDFIDSDHGLKSAANGLDQGHEAASRFISDLDVKITKLETDHYRDDFKELSTLLEGIKGVLSVFMGTLVANRAASYDSSIPSVSVVYSGALALLNKACAMYSVPNLQFLSWADFEEKYHPNDESSAYYDRFKGLRDTEKQDMMWQLEMEQYHDPDRYQQSILYSIAMSNTRELQSKIDTASAEGGTVFIPEGLFFFAPQATYKRSNEISYVIKLKSNVSIEGAGTESTKLMPLANFKDYSGFADESQIISKASDACKNGFLQANVSGVDMFYFNDLEDGINTGKSREECGNYLENVYFRDFTVDGRNAKSVIHGVNYSSAGKGFMINLMKECHWERVNVKNTDGTGFGVDCPIECSFEDCEASGCGKAADHMGPGGSGFGIGTGYCNDESIIISNCRANNNGKFGFFFEDQEKFKFKEEIEEKLKEKQEEGDLQKIEQLQKEIEELRLKQDEGREFVYQRNYGGLSVKFDYQVKNCTATDNLYNYGGLYASDVEYDNCNTEVIDSYSRLYDNPLYFKDGKGLSVKEKLTHSELLEVISPMLKESERNTGDPNSDYFWGEGWQRCEHCRVK